MAEEPHIPIGEIVGVFGLQGAVKVRPLTDWVDQRFRPGREVFLLGHAIKIRSVSDHRGQLRVYLEGIDTIDQAERLRGVEVTIPESDRPRLEANEYLVRQLVGLKVIDKRRGDIGEVLAVQQGAAQDVIVIPGARFPAVSAFVKRVSIEEGVMEVDLIQGLGPYEDDSVESERT